MRSNKRPGIGQIWRSSDPRRLMAFRIAAVGIASVLVESVYPGTLDRCVSLSRFQITGPKGYTRMS